MERACAERDIREYVRMVPTANEDDWMPTDAERDVLEQAERRAALEAHEYLEDEPVEDAPRALKSSKRPRERDVYEGRPNLADYFDEFFGPGQDNMERIKICAAYASYLRSLLPSKPKIKKEKK